MKADIHYGGGIVSLQISEANVTQIIRPWQDEEEADNRAILRQAMAGSEVEGLSMTIQKPVKLYITVRAAF